MIPSHDSRRSRWIAASAAVAIAGLCRVLGCATIVEEPSSNVDRASSTGLATNSDSGSGATLTQGSTATTMGSTATNSAAATGTSLTTSAVTTGGAMVTTSGSSSASSADTSNVASATVSNSATGSTNAVTTGGSTTTTSSSVTSGSGGSGGSGGTTVTASATSAAESSSTTGGGSEFCDNAQTPAQNVAAEGNTGSFGTTDGVCYRLDFAPADFAGWGCSNFAASGGNRAIVVNGTTVTCGELPLPEAIDGAYYFDFGPGTNAAAAMYWWNWQ